MCHLLAISLANFKLNDHPTNLEDSFLHGNECPKAISNLCLMLNMTPTWLRSWNSIVWVAYTSMFLIKSNWENYWIGNSHVPGEYWRLLFGGSLPRTTRRASERSSTYDPWSVIRTGSVIIYSEFRCRWSRLLWWIVTIVANLTLLASPARYSNMLFDRMFNSIKQHIRIPGRWS